MGFTITKNVNHWGELAAAVTARSEALADSEAVEVLAISQDLVPVLSGDLKASGHIEPGPAGAASRSVVYGTDHCLYVEYGTYKMAAQPYLTPAMEMVKRDFPAMLRAVLEKGF